MLRKEKKYTVNTFDKRNRNLKNIKAFDDFKCKKVNEVMFFDR